MYNPGKDTEGMGGDSRAVATRRTGAGGRDDGPQEAGAESVGDDIQSRILRWEKTIVSSTTNSATRRHYHCTRVLYHLFVKIICGVIPVSMCV